MNIENELLKWWDKHYKQASEKRYKNFNLYSGHYLENKTILEIANYFYELGKQS